MRRALASSVMTLAIIGCKPSQSPSPVLAPVSSQDEGVAPGTPLSEADFQKTLQATQAKYIVATVFSAD